ncbi:telomere length regulation protein-domain-containing protein [Schizophyllum commune]
MAASTESPVSAIINQLRNPISDAETLLALLAAPLDSISLLAPPLRKYNTNPLPSGNFSIARHVPQIQTALIQHIVPTWDTVLEEKQAMPLVTQYFCPDSFYYSTPAAGEIVIHALSTIVSLPLTDFSIRMLARIAVEYPIDRIHAAIFQSKSYTSKESLAWEDYIRDLCTVPGKVANFLAGARAPPPALDYEPYFSHVCTRFECLVSALPPRGALPSLTYVLTKLANVVNEKGTDGSAPQRALVKREARVLVGVLGYATKDSQIRVLACGIMLGKEWKEMHGRIFVCWAVSASWDGTNIEDVLDLWSSPDHVKHSLLSRHQYVTSLLLLTASYFPPAHPSVAKLAISPAFISGVSIYIGHMDTGVRRCGMLVAEMVARYSNKSLDFGDWDGNDRSSVWCRELRALLGARDMDTDLSVQDEEPDTDAPAPQTNPFEDVDEEPTTPSAAARVAQSAPITLTSTTYDSDDSLEGYASPSSSRSPSPTPSSLAEIEKDPSLAVAPIKVPGPVYLAQLGALVRGPPGAKPLEPQEEYKRLEIALNCAEELIRKKRGYGTELEENADNLVYGLVALQDNFDLEGFEEKRQGALTALVACCPMKAAPALAEALFQNQYSAQQRYTVLNALALGARELAGLEVPPSAVPAARAAFPSKMLPPALHQKYIAGQEANNLLPRLIDGITRKALDKNTAAAEETVPNLARERRLRLRSHPKVTEISGLVKPPPPRETTYAEIAAEYFIMPLINRFWTYLRDERTREERTASRTPQHRYRGAGVGLVLGALVLSRLLSTLAVLVHAAQNAPEWLAVVAPEALELALTLGAKPVSAAELEPGQDIEEGGKQAAVLVSALELAIIVLDGCLELDGGQSMGLEHTALLLGVGEWGGAIFSQLEKGALVQGGGGEYEVRLRRSAAGVMLKVDEMTAKWRRSMVDLK